MACATYPRAVTSPLLPWLCGLALLVGCSDAVRPAPVSTQQEVVALFVDLHFEEARVDLGLPARERAEVLEAHGLDSLRFAQLMDHYAQHPEQYVQLYEVVQDSLDAASMGRLRQ